MSGRTLAYRKVRYKATLRTLSPRSYRRWRSGGGVQIRHRCRSEKGVRPQGVARCRTVRFGGDNGQRILPASDADTAISPEEKKRADLALYELKTPAAARSLEKEARPFVRTHSGRGTFRARA